MDSKLSTQVEDVLAVMEATKCNKIVSLSLSCRSTIKACAEFNQPVDLVYGYSSSQYGENCICSK